MIGAGDRNRRVSFEQATVMTGALGTESESWAAFGAAWASVRFGAGAERRAAAMEASSQPATFIVPATTVTRALKPRDHRVIFDGRTWDIVSTMLSPNRAHMEITAIARSG